METSTMISDEPKQKISKFALIWVVAIVLCLLFFIAAMGLLGWGGYTLFQQAEEKSKIPYATATAAAQWPVIFRDDFEKVSEHWYTGDYAQNGRRDFRSISNGVYTWSIEDARGFTYWYPSKAGDFRDFTVSVDVKHTAGDKYDAYGLIFCYVAGNYYTFAINDAGNYSVYVLSLKKWNPIVQPLNSNAIRPGQFNHLMIIGENGSFKLFINDEFVNEFRDNTLSSGDVGLMLSPQYGPAPHDTGPNGVAYTFANSISTTVYDNFEVRAPGKGTSSENLPPQLPQIEPEKGKLVFASNRGKNLDIYTLSTNGSGLKQLTDNSADDYAPRWSPDGKKIVFVSKRDNGNPEIYVMDADGANQIRLTNNSVEDAFPDWSPDGHQIIFASQRGGYFDLFLMSAQGQKTYIHPLTETEYVDESYPSISPDGTHILYQQKEDKSYKLFVMQIDGKEKKHLSDSNEALINVEAAWAPDSTQFAYVMKNFADGIPGEIFISRMEPGSYYNSGIQLTSGQGTNLYPNWSPSGEQLVFVSNMDGQSDIYIIRMDGSGMFRVTHSEAVEESPDWHE